MRSRIKFVAFDLDGTLLRGETVCEMLARNLGRAERMQEIERLRDLAAVRAAREEMAAWYAPYGVAGLRGYLAQLQLAPGAVEGLQALHLAEITTAVVSVTWDFAVADVARRLGASQYLATSWHPGRITHVWPDDKAAWLESMRKQMHLNRAEVAVVGDSWGDVPMLRLAGLPIAVGSEPLDIPGLVHLPAADIRDVARRILQDSSEESRS